MQRLVYSRLAVPALAVLVLFSACFAAQAQMMMGGGHGMMHRGSGQGFPPGTDPGALPEPESRGAELLRRYCDQCHDLPGPGLHTADEWPAVVARMKKNMDSGGMMMRFMHGVRKPNSEETQILIAYLQTHGRRVMAPADLPDKDSIGAQAFQTTCAQCHALPDPKQHTAQEWPTTVARMTQNMKNMGKPVPDQATLDQIIAYLKANAG